MTQSAVFNAASASSSGVGQSGSTISYDAATNSYTISDAAFAAMFTAAERSSLGYFDVYKKPGVTLTLLNTERAATTSEVPSIKFTYVNFANYTIDNSASSGTLDQHYLVFGFPTQASEMPKTGTAAYTGAVFASFATPDASWPVELIRGRADLTADFGAGTVSTMLTLPYSNGTPNSTYYGDGLISSNQFAGKFTHSPNDFTFKSGDFAGGFFGPHAKEMGYTFTLVRGETQTTTVGAALGTTSAP